MNEVSFVMSQSLKYLVLSKRMLIQIIDNIKYYILIAFYMDLSILIYSYGPLVHTNN